MLERAVPILPGDDLAVAKEFYVGRLSFPFDSNPPTIAGTASWTSSGGRSSPRRLPHGRHGRNVCASLRVNGADASDEGWRQTVEIGRPRRNEPGEAAVRLIDPIGNSIFVIGPVVQEG